MPALDRSAPTLLVKLKNPGGDVRLVTDQIRSFKFKDRERKADLVSLTVDNRNLDNFDDPVWRKGSELVFSWGYPSAMHPERSAIVTSVKGFQTLTVEAQAKSVLMNRTVKCRTFENMKVSAIAEKIATEQGFKGEQIIVDDTEETIETVVQARMTDAQFLRRWASKLGFEFYVDFDGFHFHERRLDAAPVRVIRYHTDQLGGDIIGEPQIENDITGRPGRVRVKGRDPRTKKDIDEIADNDSDKDRKALAPITELRFDDETNAVTVTKRNPEDKVAANDTVLTGDDKASKARKLARARYRRAQQVAVKMTITIVGDPLLLAKTVIQIEGMGQRLSIRYWVTEAEHDLAPSGYTTRLVLVSDGHGGHSTESRVANTDLNRVRGQAGVGPGKGTKKRDDQLVALIQQGANAATAAGDETSAKAFNESAQLYSRRGNRARVEVAKRMQAVIQNFKAGNVDLVVAGFAGKTVSALAQSGEETATGGRVNDREISADDLALEPALVFDDSTQSVKTIYRQTKGGGQGQKGTNR